MRRLALALAFASELALAGRVRAEPAALDRFVAEVVARNPSLKARELRSTALGHDVAASGLWPDPALVVMIDRVPESKTPPMPMLQYQVRQEVPWPGKLGFMRESVVAQQDTATADADIRRLDLVLEAKRGFSMLSLNARRREINRANRNLAASVASAALARYGAGLGAHHDVARAEVEVAALDNELVDLDGERRTLIAMLNALRDRPTATEMDDPQDVAAASAISPPPLPVAERDALERRPELRAARGMQREARAMASLARREVYPDLMTGLWVNQMFDGSVTMGAMLGGALPLVGASRQRERALGLDRRAASAAADEGAMRAMIRFEIADALVKVDVATRRLALLESVVVPKARESFEASLASFGAGTLDVLGVLDARRALQTAELSRAEATTMKAVALAELDRAAGAPVERPRP